MSEENTHLAEVDGREFMLEVIGDEVVVSDFDKSWGNMMRVLSQPSTATVGEFMKPTEPLFSFPATAELKALVWAHNAHFDQHGEANEWISARLDELAAPYIREFVQREAGGS